MCKAKKGLEMNIKTASDLKYAVENTGRESYFFDRKTMRFFGDTMANFGVRKTVVKTYYDAEGNYVSEEGVDREVYELYRRKPVKAGNKSSAYFDVNTFARVHAIVEI